MTPPLRGLTDLGAISQARGSLETRLKKLRLSRALPWAEALPVLLASAAREDLATAEQVARRFFDERARFDKAKERWEEHEGQQRLRARLEARGDVLKLRAGLEPGLQACGIEWRDVTAVVEALLLPDPPAAPAPTAEEAARRAAARQALERCAAAEEALAARKADTALKATAEAARAEAEAALFGELAARGGPLGARAAWLRLEEAATEVGLLRDDLLPSLAALEPARLQTACGSPQAPPPPLLLLTLP